MLLRSGQLAEDMAVADMHRHASLQIGQREVGLAVAAIGRAQQREQRLVLVDRHQLTVAERPTLGRKIEGHDLDLGEKRLGHGFPAPWTPRRGYERGGKTPCNAMHKLRVR